MERQKIQPYNSQHNGLCEKHALTGDSSEQPEKFNTLLSM